MPPRIDNISSEVLNHSTVSNEELGRIEDVEPYDYGDGPDLKPGSPMHEYLVHELNARIQESFNERRQRFPSMRSMDALLAAFIEHDDYEKLIRNTDERRPISIVMPITYAAYNTIATNWLSILTALESLNPLRPTGPEDVIGTALAEKLMDLHSAQTNELYTRYVQGLDTLKYGYGATLTEWSVDGNYVDSEEPELLPDPYTGELIPTGNLLPSRTFEVEFEGNRVTNIDPYMLLTEPNVHIVETHLMEYCGYGSRTNRMRCLKRERTDPRWINARYIRFAAGPSTPFVDTRIREVDNYSYSTDEDEYLGVPGRGESPRASNSTNLVHEFVLFVNLVPSEWRADDGTQLGPSQYPEWWVFCLAGERLVTMAQRLNNRHSRPPITVCAPESDGYTNSPMAHLEVTRGAQQVIDYRINLYNAMIRRHFRGRWLAAEDAVNLRDLVENEDVVRISRAVLASGGSVDRALQAITMPDPFGGTTLTDATYMQDTIQRALGATEPLQGVLQAKGQRRSAEEAYGARVGALSRIERMVTLASLQSYKRSTYLKLKNLKQYLRNDTFVQIAGRWAEELMAEHGVDQAPHNFAALTPEQLQVSADVELLDVTKGGTQDAQAMLQMFQIVAGNPLLMQAFDLTRIFKNVARLSGNQNVSDFVLMDGRSLAAQVVPDEAALGGLDTGAMQRVS